MNDLPIDLRVDVLPGDDGRCTLVADGEVDLMTAPEFTRALEQALGHASEVVVDLSAVTFMDSTGLRALLRARESAERSGGRIRLAPDPSEPVAHLLDLVGVRALFEA